MRTAALCVVCQEKDHVPERGLVCDSCRGPLPALLADIAGMRIKLNLRPGIGHGAPKVSGSREAPLPLNVDALDLSLPARHIIDPGQDQIGNWPAASILDAWVRDWRERRDRGERLPVPTVAVLVPWLTVRLDWACDEHPAVDEFVRDMRDLHHAFRAAARDLARKPEICRGVICRNCDYVNTLYRRQDGTGDVECRNPECGQIMKLEEYHAWVKLVAGSTKAPAA